MPAEARQAQRVLRAKLVPPRASGRVLARPALDALVRESSQYRLTVLQAGTGFGKTTALSALASGPEPLAWLTLDEADADPARFVHALGAALRTAWPRLRAPGPSESVSPREALDLLINALHSVAVDPGFVVLDDFHTLATSREASSLAETFANNVPPSLHVIVATRHAPDWPTLRAGRAKGYARDIGRDALAFTPDEMATLLRDAHGLTLGHADVAELHRQTEGWPIAVQLLGQSARTSGGAPPAELLSRALRRPEGTTLSSLFDYLARDVLERLPAEIVEFMRDCAVLRELSASACNAVTAGSEADRTLDWLQRRELFVVALGDGQFRFHHLIHELLRAQLDEDAERAKRAHGRAARHFEQMLDFEAAAAHALQSGESALTARVVEAAGEGLLRQGQLDRLHTWIDAVPAEALAEHPGLRALLGDVYRLRSKFDDALKWYADAERQWRQRNDAKGISRALRGQAAVFLDTVRPREAEGLLAEAQRYIDGTADRDARARLLELLAENKLNLGKPAEAEALRRQARDLREEGYGEDALSVRVQLRTGRLDEAQATLESWLERETTEAARGESHAPRAHRESPLLLSLIYAIRGEAERAQFMAREGIAIGEKLHSPFVAAVGQIRLGHAWLVAATADRPPVDAVWNAIACYRAATQLGDQLAVRRTRAEAMWGLTRAHGFFPPGSGGDLQAAERAADEGIETAEWAGDVWMRSLIESALGGTYILHRQAERGLEFIGRAMALFRECGDAFGRATARLWQALGHHELGDWDGAAASIDDLAQLRDAVACEFILLRPTLAGPPDLRRLAPMWIEARARGCRTAMATRALEALGLVSARAHAGFRLRVCMLGAFRAWRGAVEIDPREWRRDKARQLFAYLISQRGRLVPREQITEALWPELAPEAAQRDFKVALNALNHALEPLHAEGSPFAFVQRDGAAYGVAREADVWVDAESFAQDAELGLRLAAAGEAEAPNRLRIALELYQGAFMSDALYDDWTTEPRERLLSLFLRAADKLAGLLLERGDHEGAIQWCERALQADSCWEHAYRLMITAYVRMNHPSQAMRVYQRCAETLRRELGVEPSPATRAALEHGQAV